MTKLNADTRVRYDEGCLAAHALNLVGDRWALLVVRELMFAPKRFQMIRSGLPGITAGVLTGRLTQLQQVGIIDHDERLGAYSLTGVGAGLLPVLEALCRFALIAPGHDPGRFISPSALMISMGANLNRTTAAEREIHVGFDFEREGFQVTLSHGHLAVTAVDKVQGTIVFSGSGNSLAAAVYGKTPLIDLTEQGLVAVEGDLSAAQDFVDLFSLEPQQQGVW